MNRVLQKDFEKIITYIIPETLRESKWLITGATGMIGSYLLTFLCYLNEMKLDNSMNITVLHRSDIEPNHPNVGKLINKKYIKFCKKDLSTDFILRDASQYDYVVHGASNAAPKIYLEDPIGTINSNVKATQIMLEALKGSNALKTFLYISSGEIYGNPGIENIPTKEEYIGLSDHLSARSCYVESKKFAETICYNYKQKYNIPIKMIRPVHVYGPGFSINDSRVWADFISKASCGKAIEILGDGLSRRGFCYLADALVQMLAVIQKGEIGEVYNIGNDKHISIKELADIIAEKSGKKVDVNIKNHLPAYLQGSPAISCPSIDKVRNLIPVLLHTTIEEGIGQSIDWVLSLKNNEVQYE